MKQRKLGKTGLEVSEIAFGGLFVASFSTGLDAAKAAVRKALDLGINYIDTAPNYGNSEEVLGHALKAADADKKPLIISTKLGGRPDPFTPQDKNALMDSVKESLRLLGQDHIDILMIHEPDRPQQYNWFTSWDEVAGPVVDLIADLKQQGVIRFSGLGGTTAYEICHLMRSGKFDVVLTAYNYSLLYREAENELLPLAKKLGMGVVVGSPLQQGALARRFDDQLALPNHWLNPPRKAQFLALYQYLDGIGMSLPEAGIRRIISNQDISCVLMGARSPEEVEANVKAAEKGALPGDVVKRLDEIAAMVPFRPFGEPFGIGWVLNGDPKNYKGLGGA